MGDVATQSLINRLLYQGPGAGSAWIAGQVSENFDWYRLDGTVIVDGFAFAIFLTQYKHREKLYLSATSFELLFGGQVPTGERQISFTGIHSPCKSMTFNLFMNIFKFLL